MTLVKLLEKYDLTIMLGVSRQAVNEWLLTKDGCLPPKRAIQVEYMTDGEFRALDLIAPETHDEWDERLLRVGQCRL